MSERKQLKEFLEKNFAQGYSPHPVYPLYLFYSKEKGFTYEILTSGVTGARFIFEHKYYSSCYEIYNDISLYFNPRDTEN